MTHLVPVSINLSNEGQYGSLTEGKFIIVFCRITVQSLKVKKKQTIIQNCRCDYHSSSASSHYFSLTFALGILFEIDAFTGGVGLGGGGFAGLLDTGALLGPKLLT